MSRPYVLLSCAMSIDGYIDDSSGQRLILSNEADFDEVDDLRASSDAILVGAGTVRADDPRLLVRSPARRTARQRSGLPPDPLRVVLSSAGDLDPAARVFQPREGQAGPTTTIMYVTTSAAERARARMGAVADVADAGDPLDLSRVLADLVGRGVGRLLVEGGRHVYTQFLACGLADELRLAVAPFFIGDPAAPRFDGDDAVPWVPGHPARLAGISRVGDIAVLRYAFSDRFGSG